MPSTIEGRRDSIGGHLFRSSRRNVCSECKKIKFREARKLNVEGAPPRTFEHVLLQVGRRLSRPIEASCVLCDLLKSFKIKPKWLEQHETSDKISVLPFLDVFDGTDLTLNQDKSDWHIKSRVVCLAIIPKDHSIQNDYSNARSFGSDNGWLVVQARHFHQPEAFSVNAVSPRFDPKIPREWLEYCRTHHGRDCFHKPPMSPNLKLIDCISRKIVLAPENCQYVALSYVWGPSKDREEPLQPEASEEGFLLPENLPRVITDSITVVKSLGMSFLWVDKFCVRQDESAEKFQQIRHMDAVYRTAELTILAAAGDDEDYGLPGVGSTSRKRQASVDVGSSRLISSMASPRKTIQASKWATRGWTYQEAVLSRRRLFFTDEQVYFECDGMACRESLCYPLDQLHVKDRSQMYSFMQSSIFGNSDESSYGFFSANTSDSPRTTLRQFRTHIEHYSGRHLRNKGDVMHAFAGIGKKFATSLHQVYNHLGVPFRDPLTQPHKARCDFILGLCWYHRNSAWDIEEAPRRRDGFPSWSWAGWIGKVSYLSNTSGLKLSFFATKVTTEADLFCVCSQTGRVVQLQELEEASELNNHNYNMLQLQARAIPCSDFKLVGYQWSLYGFNATLKLSTGPRSTDEFYRELKDAQSKKWQTVYICDFATDDAENAVVMILLQTNDKFSRAGLFLVEWDRYQWQPMDRVRSQGRKEFIII